MSKYKSREEAYEAFCNTPAQEWYDWIESLAVEARTIKTPLYHLSFNGNNPGIWKPAKLKMSKDKLPNPTGANSEILCEILTKGICTSSTYEGCWAGIYPNVNKLFENKSQHHDTGTVFCYVASPTSRTLVLTPEILDEEFLIWDAHYTKEYRILGECKMELDSLITFKNTADYPRSKHTCVNPFNDSMIGQTVKGYVPPFIIVDIQPIKNKRNSKMSIYSTESFNLDKGGLTIKTSNADIMKQISLEMSLHPLNKLDSFVTDKFLTLLGRLNAFVDIKNSLPLTGKHLDIHTLNLRDSAKVVERHDYISIMKRNLDVPQGFKGPYTPYSNAVLDMLNKYGDIVNNVTKPCVNALQVILSNPVKLTSATLSTLDGIEDKTKHEVEFKTLLPNYFEVKSTNTVATFGQLFSNNADYMVAARKAKDIEEVLGHKDTYKTISNVARDVEMIGELIDRLIVRIKQDSASYAINSRMAVDIATAVERVAETVTFYGALLHMAEECHGVMVVANRKLK